MTASRIAWAVAALITLVGAVAACGSEDVPGANDDATLDIDEDYRLGPPLHRAYLATVRATAVGDDPYTVPLIVWNLGTEPDIYRLEAVFPDDSENPPLVELSPSQLELDGRSFAVASMP